MEPSSQTLVTRSQLVNDLLELGVAPGQTLMLHASVRSVGWLVGGPDIILQALLEALAPDGTLMMYVSWEEWERGLVQFDSLSLEQQRIYREECPPFDPQVSRANRQWSVLTEYLRTWPGACRSNHPTASVAAVGKQSRWLTADQPLAYGYGMGSPFDKLCQSGGKVLLLGSPIATVTLLHYAEHIARIPRKRVVKNRLPLLVDGRREWVEFEEFDTCEGIREDVSSDQYFESIVREYMASGKASSAKVGLADSYLFDAADLARFAVDWLERTRKE